MSLSAPPPDERPGRFRATWSVERMLLACALFWVLAANRPLLAFVVRDQPPDAPSTWFALACWVVALTALHALLLAPLANRYTARPLLAVMIIVTALSAYYMQHLSVYLDPTMLRNVMRTDVREAGELVGPGLLLPMLLTAVLPLVLLWRVRPAVRPWRRALLVRIGFMLAMAGLLVGAVLAQFQPLASMMRNHKEARYLITPANVLWSVTSVATAATQERARPRQPIGEDAVLVDKATRPQLVVFVVGETARAANWGLNGRLNGYARDTTPELGKLPTLLNYTDVTSCGTNTEVSLPCIFAPVGRRDHDERRIRGQQSLLHVLSRAGVGVLWRDNQSGCKGVCEGLAMQMAADFAPPGLCSEGRCYDEALLAGLPEMLRGLHGTQFLVLHPIGNHGPAYFRRYPPAHRHYLPACEQDDLRRCTREEVVNAYDNALRYTDRWLAQLVRTLDAASDRVDTAMVFVSDHGESLGENNLWLHGLPYAIAPDVQKKVPMVAWTSEGFARRKGLDVACLRGRTGQPVSHDHLFHTLLTMNGVRTSLHEPAWDLTTGCRQAESVQP